MTVNYYVLQLIHQLISTFSAIKDSLGDSLMAEGSFIGPLIILYYINDLKHVLEPNKSVFYVDVNTLLKLITSPLNN